MMINWKGFGRNRGSMSVGPAQTRTEYLQNISLRALQVDQLLGCFGIGYFLLGIVFDPEDGGDTFPRTAAGP
jgi:hypothetical protein